MNTAHRHRVDGDEPDAELTLFRETVRRFAEREVVPHQEEWEADGLIDRRVWKAAGAIGMIGLAVPEEYGGAGIEDFRFRFAVVEELVRAGAASFNAGTSAHEDIVGPYLCDLGTPEQRRRWLPGLASGELIGALAMTEPETGSDLRGIRTVATPHDDGWMLRGAKTFITNGILADLVIVFARIGRTDERYGLFLVDTTLDGFRRGRKLDKLGLRANDTAELVLDDVVLPAAGLLGEEGAGLRHLKERLPLERLSIAATSIAAARWIFETTVRYCFERSAFGRPIGGFQANRFTLAEMATEIDVARSYFDSCVDRYNLGTLSAVDAAKAKWWISELHNRVAERCLQLHGGYGYMREYPVARAYVDARIQTIYGGTNEIMKDIIGRDLARTATTGPRN